LEKNERFHILQKPTITTLNHQPATIYIGQQIAIPGETLSSVNNVDSANTIRSTTQYIPVRLQLDITPHIYNNGEVMLEFQQQNNDISGFTTISGNQIPNISEQGMRNSLIVPDRTTVMLGGLITERDRKGKSGLPFLVRIPVLKHLFGSTSKSKERRELMIFVQPHILSDGADHIQEQSAQNRHSLSYPRTREFSESGGATPLLPLPEWNESQPIPKALPVEPGIQPRSTGKAK
jgi:type II secretory pathway component GspD/PulD (secretin)